MLKISAVVQTHKLDEVRDALTAVGVGGITMTEVMGYGRQKGHTEIYRGAEYKINFIPKALIEIIASEKNSAAIISAIQKAANTGKIGDGKIWVTPVLDVLRIRTGERGEEAI